jgi:hypothetical protein
MSDRYTYDPNKFNVYNGSVDFVDPANPVVLQMGRGYAPGGSENWGRSSEIADRTPGWSANMGAPAHKFAGALGLGKAGLFGVPYLGLGLGLLGASGLFKRKRRTDPYAEITGMAREGEAEANRYAGELGSLGMDLQTGGRAMQERGRAGYLDALMNPNVAMAERAALASQMGAATRGMGPMVGLLGGPGAAAAYARNASQYNPALASGLTQIGSNALNRRAQGYQSMAGFGQQDFGQGLGLRGQGFNVGQQGRQNLMGVLQRNEQMRQAQRAQQQSGMNALFGGLGTGLGGGLFK